MVFVKRFSKLTFCIAKINMSIAVTGDSDNVVSIHKNLSTDEIQRFNLAGNGKVQTLQAVQTFQPEVYTLIYNEFLSSGIDLNNDETMSLIKRHIHIVDSHEMASYFPRLKVADSLSQCRFGWVYYDKETLTNSQKRGLLKPFPSIRNKNGKTIKYLSFPRDLAVIPIVPQPERSDDTVYLTEGVKKCLSLINLGYDAIAVQGVYNVGQRYSAEEIYSSQLVLSKIRDKKLVIVFDSDFQKNSQVLAALKEVITYFQKIASSVYIALWGYSEKTKGIDDYLNVNGVEKTHQTLKDALSVEHFVKRSQKFIVEMNGLNQDTCYLVPESDLMKCFKVESLTVEAQVAEIHTNLFKTVFYNGYFYQFDYDGDIWKQCDDVQLNRQIRAIWGQYKGELEEMVIYATRLITTADAIRERNTINRSKQFICCSNVIVEIDLYDYSLRFHENNRENKIKHFIRQDDIIPIEYVSNITDEHQALWNKFAEILPPEILEYVLTINSLAFNPEAAFDRLGRSMKFLFHYGSGSNGKDLLRKVILGAFVPSQICSINMQNLTKDFALESYIDKTISWSSENIPRDLSKLEVLKNLCTQDEIEVRRKHKNSIRYKFALVANFNTNHTPNLGHLYESMDRYAIIEYPYIFKDKKECTADNHRPRYHFSSAEESILQSIALYKMLTTFCETMKRGSLVQPECTDMIKQGKKKSWLALMIEDDEIQQTGLMTIGRFKTILYQWLARQGEGNVLQTPSGIIFEPHEKISVPKSTRALTEYCIEMGLKNLTENKLVLENGKRVKIFTVGGISIGKTNAFINYLQDLTVVTGELSESDKIKVKKIWDKNNAN